jgi:hypothetical protein
VDEDGRVQEMRLHKESLVGVPGRRSGINVMFSVFKRDVELYLKRIFGEPVKEKDGLTTSSCNISTTALTSRHLTIVPEVGAPRMPGGCRRSSGGSSSSSRSRRRNVKRKKAKILASKSHCWQL